MRPRRFICLAAAGFFVAGSSAAGPHVHRHGVVQMTVAVDGDQLGITLQVPLDSLLGFERAPRTEAERRAAADVLAQLRRHADTLFMPDAAAGCRLVRADVQAGVLESSAGAAAASGGEHADVAADYAFACAQPAQLRSLQVALFDAFRRIRHIEVQVAGPKGQRKATLQGSARTVDLPR